MNRRFCVVLSLLLVLCLCVCLGSCKQKEEPPAGEPAGEQPSGSAPETPVQTPEGDSNPRQDGDTYRY